MNKTPLLEYMAVKTNNENKIGIFLKLPNELLDIDFDIGFQEDLLKIKTSDNFIFNSKPLTEELISYLSIHDTLIVFTNNEGNLLAEHLLPAQQKSLNHKKNTL